MKRKIKLIIVGILACICHLPALAQSGKLFNTDNQLSSNLATQVYQDTNGFIWITTRNGLNIYDGYNFSVVKKGGKDNRELNTNYINCIAQDYDGYVLLGTNRGLLLHNGQYFLDIPLPDGKGNPISTYVTHIGRLQNGDVLIGTSGYGIFLMKKQTRNCTPLKATQGKINFVLTFLEGKRGGLWIISERHELFFLDKNGKLNTHIPGTEGLLAQDIRQDSKGTLYLATKGQGVYQMTPGARSFTKIAQIGNLPIKTIYTSKNDRLFIGCDGEGISLYDPTFKMVYTNPFFSSQTNLSKSKVENIIEDKQGNIWFSMMQKGVFMQPQGLYDFGYMGFRSGNHNLIGDNCATSVLIDKDNHIWVGTDKDGIYQLAPNTKNCLGHYLPQATILGICQDLKGRIWIGTYENGVGVLDGSGNYHPLDIKELENIGTFDIKCDKWGYVWFATMGKGIFCISPDGKVKNYQMQSNAENDSKMNSLPNNYIAKIAFSKDHSRVYAATSIGLACLDRKKNSWTSAFGGGGKLPESRLILALCLRG